MGIIYNDKEKISYIEDALNYKNTVEYISKEDVETNVVVKNKNVIVLELLHYK